MNKLKNLLILTFLCLFLVACGDSNTETSEEKIDNQLIENDMEAQNSKEIEDEGECKKEVAQWEDENFEKMIRYYLNNFDKDIYVEDLNDITELKISLDYIINTNLKECEISKEDRQKIDSIKSMKDIDNFNNLEKIDISNNEIEELYIYKNSSNITHLNFNSNKIEDITNIKEYNNLTHLDISNNFIENIKPINSLSKLKNLALANIGYQAPDTNYPVESEIDLINLENLKNLETLTIEISNLYNVSKFNELDKLTHLHLFACHMNPNELDFSNCKSIESLGLNFSNYTNSIDFSDDIDNTYDSNTKFDIKKLDNLVNLKSLGISNAYIDKNADFSKLKNLKNLSFYSTVFEDINVLKSLQSLEEISLTEININDLKSLINNRDLKKLCIVETNINDISDIKEFSKLEYLDLDNNYDITDINPITKLNNLTRLSLVNIPDMDSSVIKELENRDKLLFFFH